MSGALPHDFPDDFAWREIEILTVDGILQIEAAVHGSFAIHGYGDPDGDDFYLVITHLPTGTRVARFADDDPEPVIRAARQIEALRTDWEVPNAKPRSLGEAPRKRLIAILEEAGGTIPGLAPARSGMAAPGTVGLNGHKLGGSA